YAFAAAYSTGVLMPMGFEYGWGRPLAVVMGRDEAPEPKRFDLSPFIAEINAVKGAISALNEEGPQRLLASSDDRAVVVERSAESSPDRAVIALNRDPTASPVVETELPLGPLAVEALGVRVIRLDTAAEQRTAMPALWRPDARIQIEEVYPTLDNGRYP